MAAAAGRLRDASAKPTMSVACVLNVESSWCSCSSLRFSISFSLNWFSRWTTARSAESIAPHAHLGAAT